MDEYIFAIALVTAVVLFSAGREYLRDNRFDAGALALIGLVGAAATVTAWLL